MRRYTAVLIATLLGAAALTFTGCPPRYDVLEVSPGSYNFELSDVPWFFQVWNADPDELAEATFQITSNRDWLHVTPTEGTSTGTNDRKNITVTVNREGLSEGRHEGTITVGGEDLVPKEVKVYVTSEGDTSTTGGWQMKDVAERYASPYLLEFAFALRDADDHAVTTDPSAFETTCMEDAAAISSETDSLLARGSNRQLMAYLVLDYTLSMYQAGAIDDMEGAAKTVFLDSLNSDAQVGIYEFHRGDQEPGQVADFTADKEFLKGRIDAIWDEFVRNFPAESRCWDALYAAASQFDEEDLGDEQRTIVFLSDGDDESSTHTHQEVIDLAKARNISIYCIGFGVQEQKGSDVLQVITQQTGGQYYTADAASDLATQFQQIITDLGGQYVLRWATLKRADQPFTPSFKLMTTDEDGEHTLRYTAENEYRPTDWAGEPLQGVLRMVVSQGESNTTAFLRATYVPRYITQIAITLSSPYTFTASLVSAEDGGLCSDWILMQETNSETGDVDITVQRENPSDIFSAIPYAGFGPILQLYFSELVEDTSTLFDAEPVIDNSLYTGGQTFVIEWPPQLPAKSWLLY